jgi:hypothetical protein
MLQGAGVGELMFAGSSRKGMMDQKLLVTLTSDRYINVCIYIYIYICVSPFVFIYI